MTLRPALAGLAAALLVSAQAPAPASGSPSGTADPVVAQSGEITLTAAAVRQLLDQADPALREQLRRDPAALAQIVRTDILRRVLLDEAKAKKWDQKPDVAARANQARDAVIVNTYVASLTEPPADYPSDADIASAYEANKARFMVPRQYHLAQIFVAVAQGAPKSAEDEAARRARDLRTALGKPHADFAEIARHGSDEKASAEKGGDLGWAREDALIPAVKDAVAGLAEGAVTEPLRAADGFHIVRLIATRPAAPAPLADVRDAVARALRQQRAAQAERALLDETMRRQPVRIDEIQLSRTVQP